MCFPTFTALGSLLLLFAFVLELFIMIGNLTNTDFLRRLYFAEAWNKSQNVSYTFGLWNMCTGDGNGNNIVCGSRGPAFNWARNPAIAPLVPSQADSTVVRGIFLAMFILFFIGCGLSFVFWCFSLPICCMKRKGWGYSMSTLVFINFLVMLAALILALVTILSGIKAISANDGWSAHAGDSLWLTIGAVVALLFSFLCYTGGSICGRKRTPKKGTVDPNYNNKDAYAQGTPYAGTPLFVPHQQTGMSHQQGTSTMLQQPYAVSSPTTGHQNVNHHQALFTPRTGNQQAYDPNVVNNYDNTAYDATANQNYDPNSVSVPMHGYQTPTLQPANTPH